jgi:hypothetical protein
MKCSRAGCLNDATYNVSGVLIRGKAEFKGFSGGFFTAAPQSSTGTETEELQLYACDEHSAWNAVRGLTVPLNDEARTSDPEGYAHFGPWRITDYKRERLPH